jgi:hypothetical protein
VNLREKVTAKKEHREGRAEALRQRKLGIPDDADQCSGHADHRFRDDPDRDSGMMPITRSGMIAIS